MKAVVYTEYGSPDILQFQEVEKPAPKEDEVLVQVFAAAVNAADWHLLRGDPFFVRLDSGLSRPKRTILGADIAGRVAAVGSAVTAFKPGDEVFGDISGCGFGGFAQYVCAKADVLVRKPAGVSFEEAAAVPMAAVTALQGLRDKGGIQPGQKVLINGASGGVGTFAVQIASAFGAEVTGVCSTGKMEMVRSLGAERVIDYTCEDFTQNGQQYDLILAANGNRWITDYRRALGANGVYVCVGGSMGQIFQAMLLGPLLSLAGGKKMVGLLATPNATDLTLIRELLDADKIAPVIDRRYSLRETAEALRYVDAGHAKGKVVVTVEHGV